MKKLINYIIAFLLLAITEKTVAQGCVAIRSTGGFCTMTHDSAGQVTGSKWQLNVNNRYFKSYKHFVGTDEQKQRQTLGTEVINHSYTMDLGLNYNINERWSVAMDLPIEAYSRSSLYEHKNIGRYLTHSFGVGDIRFAVYSWLWDPAKEHKGNIQLGLGIKLPTGDYRYQDYFMLTDSTKVLGPVDQSIQLGDGGTGFTFEANAYYNFSKHVSVYGNFYYLSNPREQNGVSTGRGSAVAASAIKNGSDVMSVPDQLMARAGVAFNFNKFSFSVGGRDECLPVCDLIGGSNGFRRPGYIISAEPGATYKIGKVSVYAYVPYALIRNRTQSVADKITTDLTGKFTQGDAAFADYAVNVGAIFKF